MIKVILYILFLVTIFCFFPSNIYADDATAQCQPCDPGAVLNKSVDFCQNNGNGTESEMEKSGCVFNAQCTTYPNICTCNITTVDPTSCGNPGGAPNASTQYDAVLGQVSTPPQVADLGFGADGIQNILSKIITLIYIVGGIIFVFMIVFSAFQWVSSGGEKEAIASARKRLINAIIGITLLALAGLIINLIAKITGISFIQ